MNNLEDRLSHLFTLKQTSLICWKLYLCGVFLGAWTTEQGAKNHADAIKRGLAFGLAQELVDLEGIARGLQNVADGKVRSLDAIQAELAGQALPGKKE